VTTRRKAVAMPRMTTAPSPAATEWRSIDWATASREVQRLQQRIFRASKEQQWRKVRSLQKLLLRSEANLVLAVRQVTQVNAGRNTPGVDGQVANTAEKRGQLLRQLRTSHRHRVRPVGRVSIPKANGKQPPLGIPTIEDRARQAVVKAALEPCWEAQFEPTSYGFRPGRSAQDAIQALFLRLRSSGKSQWVLDADIRGAFDNISHQYILRRLGNFPGRAQIARWLQAGYVEQGRLFVTEAGTPQGGVVSPLLANIALDGLSQLLTRQRSADWTTPYFGYVRYADDIVVTSPDRERLEQMLPCIRTWLAERGLELNEEKTRIVHVDDGFDFLGFNLRRYKGKLLIKPQKDKVLESLRELKRWIRHQAAEKQEPIIANLNRVLRGWAQYYRHVVSKAIFGYVDARIFRMLWSWCKRRHPGKTASWRRKRYFRSIGGRSWVFAANGSDRRGEPSVRALIQVVKTPIVRHVLVKGSNSPMDPTLREYWRRRNAARGQLRYATNRKQMAIGHQQRWMCPVCRQPLFNEEPLDTHHLQRVIDGGTDAVRNLQIRHEACHHNAHGSTQQALHAFSA
jgi:RNA-directed DNA polymerase